jgi:hypothetical protein
MLQDGDQSWCLGIPAHTRRSLEPDERLWLEQELTRSRRYLRGWRLSLRIAGGMAALGTVPSYFLAYDRSRPLIASLLLCGLLSLPALSVPPAIAEVIVGRGGRVRFLLVLPLVLALIGFAASSLDGDARGGIVFALFVLSMTTLPAVLLLWWRYRELSELIPAIERDFDSGDVLVFQGMPDERPEKLVKVGLPRSRQAECSFAVLPLCGVVLPTRALRAPAWTALEVVHTAAVVSSAMTASIPGVAAAADAKVELLQRHMTPAEVDEIKRHRKHLARRSLLVFLTMGYFAVRLAQMCEIAMRRSHHGQVSMAGWVIALTAGAYFGLRPLRLRSLLGRAAAERRILVVRERDAAIDEPAFTELLANTLIAWTVDGKPAMWRRKKL